MKIKTELLQISIGNNSCDIFISKPDDSQKHPAVLMYMDAFGPRESLYDLAKTLSENGYFVLVPNLFFRQLKAPFFDFKTPLQGEDLAKTRELVIPLAKNFDAKQGLEDAGHYLNFLKNRSDVSQQPIAITGYCMGGRMALQTAAKYPEDICAIAGFHSAGLATNAENSPHLLLPQVKAEIYYGHADQDASLPPEQIQRFQQALQKTSLRYETEIYTGAPHGFMMRDLPAFNSKAFDRHWQKLLPLLQRTLHPSA